MALPRLGLGGLSISTPAVPNNDVDLPTDDLTPLTILLILLLLARPAMAPPPPTTCMMSDILGIPLTAPPFIILLTSPLMPPIRLPKLGAAAFNLGNCGTSRLPIMFFAAAGLAKLAPKSPNFLPMSLKFPPNPVSLSGLTTFFTSVKSARLVMLPPPPPKYVVVPVSTNEVVVPVSSDVTSI